MRSRKIRDIRAQVDPRLSSLVVILFCKYIIVNYWFFIITPVSCILRTQLWFVHLIASMQMILVLTDLNVTQIETRKLETSLASQLTCKLHSPRVRWLLFMSLSVVGNFLIALCT